MYLTCYKLLTNTTQVYIAKNFSSSIFSVSSPFRWRQPRRQWYCLKSRVSNFHTTQRMYSPTSAILSIASIASGCYLRYWWLKQTPMKREEYLKWYKNKRFKIHGTLAVISLVMIAYLSTFIKRDPVINRPRLVLFSDAEQAENAQVFAKLIVHSRDNVVPFDDPMYSRILSVMKNLGRSNEHLFKDSNWRVTIIRRMFDITPNPTVLVLPDATIIAFSDIFKFVKNDDQLTFVLAHEMAHQILLHTTEVLSFKFLRTVLLDITAFVCFAFYPFWIAFVHFVLYSVVSQSIFYWYKRRREMEADKIGLELCARSCIDLREVFVFLEILKKYKDLLYKNTLFDFSLFKIHPSLEDRLKKMNEDLPKLLQLRNEANCPELPDMDPRDNLPRYLKELEDNLRTDRNSFGVQL